MISVFLVHQPTLYRYLPSIMSSMAATLAGLQPAPAAAPSPAQQQQARRAAGAQAGHIPARYEEALDVEGELPINDVELNGTVSRGVYLYPF